MLMNKKDKAEARVSKERWRWDLAVLCDVSYNSDVTSAATQIT
jgi:hypothetical protein